MGDIGTGGEHFFMGFCSVEGVTANKSQADRNGWDVFVEVDQSIGALTQTSLHLPLISGKVQVKSTEKKSLKVPVSLSNLRKLATSSLPTFYVLMDFSDGMVPSRAFIRHVDEELIRAILKRVNEHVVAGKQDRLHKLQMQVDFGKGVEISLKDPTSFKTQIIAAVGNAPALYTEKKLKYLKTVGYEGGGGNLMRFNIQGIENLRALAEATMGMGRPIEMRNAHFFTKRFGLEDPRSRRDFAATSMRLTPCGPSAKGTLTFRNLKTGATAQVEAAAYFSGLQEWLPEGMRRIRFDCGMFDWITTVDGSETQFNSTLNPETPVKLEDLARYLEIVCLMNTPESLRVDIDFNGLKSTVSFKHGTAAHDFSGMLETADILLKIKMLFKDRAILEISANELFQSRHIIRDFHAFLAHEAPANISFTGDIDQPFDAVILVSVNMEICGKIYLTVVAIQGDMSYLGNGRCSVQTSQIDPFYIRVIQQEGMDEEEVIRGIDAAIADFEHPLPIVNLVPLMRSLVPHEAGDSVLDPV